MTFPLPIFLLLAPIIKSLLTTNISIGNGANPIMSICASRDHVTLVYGNPSNPQLVASYNFFNITSNTTTNLGNAIAQQFSDEIKEFIDPASPGTFSNIYAIVGLFDTSTVQNNFTAKLFTNTAGACKIEKTCFGATSDTLYQLYTYMNPVLRRLNSSSQQETIIDSYPASNYCHNVAYSLQKIYSLCQNSTTAILQIYSSLTLLPLYTHSYPNSLQNSHPFLSLSQPYYCISTDFTVHIHYTENYTAVCDFMASNYVLDVRVVGKWVLVAVLNLVEQWDVGCRFYGKFGAMGIPLVEVVQGSGGNGGLPQFLVFTQGATTASLVNAEDKYTCPGGCTSCISGYAVDNAGMCAYIQPTPPPPPPTPPTPPTTLNTSNISTQTNTSSPLNTTTTPQNNTTPQPTTNTTNISPTNTTTNTTTPATQTNISTQTNTTTPPTNNTNPPTSTTTNSINSPPSTTNITNNTSQTNTTTNPIPWGGIPTPPTPLPTNTTPSTTPNTALTPPSNLLTALDHKISKTCFINGQFYCQLYCDYKCSSCYNESSMCDSCASKRQMDGNFQCVLPQGISWAMMIVNAVRTFRPSSVQFSFLAFDAIQLFQYHLTNYTGIFEEVLQEINDMDNFKWSLVSIDSILDWTQRPFLPNSTYNYYTNPRYIEIQHTNALLFETLKAYYSAYIPIAFVIFFMLNRLFLLTVDYRISQILRPYSFWLQFFVVVFVSDAAKLSFLFINYFGLLFSSCLWIKMTHCISIFAIGLFVIITLSLFFLSSYLYGDLSKYFLFNLLRVDFATGYAFLRFSLKPLLASCLHALLFAYPQWQMISLAALEIIFLILSLVLELELQIFRNKILFLCDSALSFLLTILIVINYFRYFSLADDPKMLEICQISLTVVFYTAFSILAISLVHPVLSIAYFLIFGPSIKQIEDPLSNKTDNENEIALQTPNRQYLKDKKSTKLSQAAVTSKSQKNCLKLKEKQYYAITNYVRQQLLKQANRKKGHLTLKKQKEERKQLARKRMIRNDKASPVVFLF